MAQRIYATASDYYEFTGGDDPNLDDDGEEVEVPTTDAELNAKLRRASTIIDGITRNSVYDVDDDGYATDPDITEAFVQMTCAQVAWWDDTDDISGAGSQEGTVSIGSVSIGARGRSTSTGSNGTPNAQASRIAPEAIEIAKNAGLLSSAVSHT